MTSQRDADTQLARIMRRSVATADAICHEAEQAIGLPKSHRRRLLNLLLARLGVSLASISEDVERVKRMLEELR